MATDCGVSTRMWVKYEQGLSMPGGEVFLALANQAADMEYLFTGIILEDGDYMGMALLSDEQDLVKNYRQATDRSKEIIATLAEMVEKKPIKSIPIKGNEIFLFEADIDPD